ncbi:apolipoprotein D-like [Eriocheir sinensis]|uniref:apolipoprotein D-like n=1 Tax=Eriocheir sinensis TaxID=95602 RepID=UPI0021C88350|nr:apolipoprotein D-like [Eriocheir sinensis]
MRRGVAAAVLVLLEGSLLSLVSSQRLALGRCPSPPAVDNFDFEDYAGVWFQVQRYSHPLEFRSPCVSVRYIQREDETNSYDTITRYSGSPHIWSSLSFSGRLTGVDPTRDLSIFYQSHGFFPRFKTSPRLDSENYRVIFTDYCNVAAVFNCREFGFFNIQYLWVMTRDRKPDPNLIFEIRAILLAQGLSVDDLRSTPQDGCEDEDGTQNSCEEED